MRWALLLVSAVGCAAHLSLPESYTTALYGTPSALTAGDVDVVWYNLLPWAERLKLLPWNPFVTKCWYDWTWLNTERVKWRPDCMLVAKRIGVHAAAPPHRWVETTHAGTATGVVPERSVAWFYLARGSGLWINTGRTIVYSDHATAVRAVLNVTCEDMAFKSPHRTTPCTLYFDLLFAKLQPEYDSVQFTHHCDMGCGCTSAELVIIRPGVAGVPGCPTAVDVRAGVNASRACTCDPGKQYLNCDGNLAWTHCRPQATVRGIYAGAAFALGCGLWACARRKRRAGRAHAQGERQPLMSIN
jgi:hypothetical protein